MVSPLLLYKFNEASSGQAPASVLDSSPGAPSNLTITYGTGTAAWDSIAAGDGLFTGVHHGNDANGTRVTGQVGTKVSSALAATKTATWEFVVQIPDGTSLGAGLIFDVTNSGGTTRGLGGIYKRASENTWELYDPSGTLSYSFTAPITAAGISVTVHVVVDTAQAVAADRVTVYFNGVSQFLNVISAFALNSTWSPSSTDYCTMLGGPAVGTLNNVTQGTLYYAALYSSALTVTQVLGRSFFLQNNNDYDPNAAVLMVESGPFSDYAAAISRPVYAGAYYVTIGVTWFYASGVPSVNGQSGWTLIGNVSDNRGSDNVSTAVLGKYVADLTAEPATYTIDLTAGGDVKGQVIIWDNVDPNNPTPPLGVTSFAHADGNVSIVVPDATAIRDGSASALICGDWNFSAWNLSGFGGSQTAPAGYTSDFPTDSGEYAFFYREGIVSGPAGGTFGTARERFAVVNVILQPTSTDVVIDYVIPIRGANLLWNNF